MADNEETEQDPTETSEQLPPDGNDNKDDVDAMRRALRKANKEAETTRLKLKEIEDRDKTESDRAAEKAAEAEKRATKAETDLLRHKVGVRKGLPAELIDRLQGDTEDEMAADADALLKAFKPARNTAVPAGPRGAESEKHQSVNDMIRSAAGRTQ